MSSNIRMMKDPIGFATNSEQMEQVVERITAEATASGCLSSIEPVSTPGWRVAVCPHDDYTYVGRYYMSLLRHIKAKTVFLFGVAHRAKLLNLEHDLIFDKFDAWAMPYGNVPVSSLRDEIIAELPASAYQVHQEMQTIEHSIEAIIPFLQRQRRDMEIVPIVIPYMSYARMMELGPLLGAAMAKVVTKHGLTWGRDYAVVISTDAVHYGDEDWGGQNFAQFGVDQAGYDQAVRYEHEIIEGSLTEALTPERVKIFTEHTVSEKDFREYKWTWCGRYSVPCGLLSSYFLQQALQKTEKPLIGALVGYGTSVDGREHIPVKDIGMGETAPANLRHWVGFACVGYQ